MMPQPLTLNPNYLAMVRGVRELHLLIAEGKDDSPEADAIRDATDAPWESLSEIERRRIRNLSEDLYSLLDSETLVPQSNPQAMARLAEVFEAQNQGDWDRALDLLRRWGSFIDPALVSYVRGKIWLEAGDPATSAMFFEHAARLRPESEYYTAMLLLALDRSDAESARLRADEILLEPEKSPPVVVARAVAIAVKSINKLPEFEAHKHFLRLMPILESLRKRFEHGDEKTLDRSSYLLTVTLLGIMHEFLKDMPLALKNYSEGLQVDPLNDVLLVARGMILYGTSERAITDFGIAIQNGSPLVWPYFLLAHDHLSHHRFEECRRLAEQALAFPGSSAVRSELFEWMAISQSELGFPVETVRASFESALRYDPSNDRARRNYATFEQAVRSTDKTWETPSFAAVRSSALSERRYTMAG